MVQHLQILHHSLREGSKNSHISMAEGLLIFILSRISSRENWLSDWDERFASLGPVVAAIIGSRRGCYLLKKSRYLILFNSQPTGIQVVPTTMFPHVSRWVWIHLVPPGPGWLRNAWVLRHMDSGMMRPMRICRDFGQRGLTWNHVGPALPGSPCTWNLQRNI